MKTFLNIIWYFPFFGFVFAILTAINGLFWCLTVIGLPLGLGLLQIAKFLFAPHTYELISQKDLSAAKGESRNQAWVIFSAIIRVLYFPIGLLLAILYIFIAIANFISIIGIPNGLVYVKLIPAVFNPVGKVCVGGAIARKIRADKEQAKVDNYFGNTPAANQNASCNATQPSNNVASSEDDSADRPKPNTPRNLSDEKLAEVLSHPTMYRAEVIEACRKEKDIRDNIAATMPEIEAMPMDKIIEIARSPKTYSPVAVRCAQILMKKEDDRRKAVLAEQQRREAAELQARREAELQRRKEQMQQVLEFIKKWKYAIGAAVIAIAAIWYGLWVVSDSHRFNVMADASFEGDYEKVIDYAKKIDNPDSKYYQPALILGLSNAQIAYQLSDKAKNDSIILRKRLDDYVESTPFNEENFLSHNFYWQQVYESIDKTINDSTSIGDNWLRIANAYENCEVSESSGVWEHVVFAAGYAYFMSENYNAAAILFERIVNADGDVSKYASAYLGIINLFSLNSNPCSRKDAYAMLFDGPYDGVLSFYKGLAELFSRRNDFEERLNNAQFSFGAASAPAGTFYSEAINFCNEAVSKIIETESWKYSGFYSGNWRYIGPTKVVGWTTYADGWAIEYNNDAIIHGKWKFDTATNESSLQSYIWLDDDSGNRIFYLSLDDGSGMVASKGGVRPFDYQTSANLLCEPITLSTIYGFYLSPLYDKKKYDKLMERYADDECMDEYMDEEDYD